MRYFIFMIIFACGFQAISQPIPAETFREHMLTLSENKDILKKYKVEDENGNPVFFINLGSYGDYHQAEPIPNRNGEMFLWNQGSIFFYDVPYYLELLSIEEDDHGMIFYRFNYYDGKKKWFIEAKFGNRYDQWELVDVAITRVKSAY